MGRHDFSRTTVEQISSQIESLKQMLEDNILSLENMPFSWRNISFNGAIQWAETLLVRNDKNRMSTALQNALTAYGQKVGDVEQADDTVGKVIAENAFHLQAISDKLQQLVAGVHKDPSVSGSYAGLRTTILNIDKSNGTLDFERMTAEEQEQYYQDCINMDPDTVTETDREQMQRFCEYLKSKQDMDYSDIWEKTAVVANVLGMENCQKYNDLYELLYPEKAATVNDYIDQYASGLPECEIELIKYNCYTNKYRYNLISSMQNGRIQNGVYDENNPDHYGSRQHSALLFWNNGYSTIMDKSGKRLYDDEYLKKKKDDYERILKKNFSSKKYKKITKTNKKMEEYMSGINEEGCGYAALINTIFVYYEGRETEFYNKFGYPMRDEHGDLNYDLLLVDIYSSMDDSGKTGLTSEQIAETVEEFMEKPGADGSSSVKVNAKYNVSMTVEKYYEHILNGEQVILSGSGYTMEYIDANGVYRTRKLVNEKGIPEGHAMTITGVTEDGKFIVSTWGYIGYVDPNQSEGTILYQTIKYE